MGYAIGTRKHFTNSFDGKKGQTTKLQIMHESDRKGRREETDTVE